VEYKLAEYFKNSDAPLEATLKLHFSYFEHIKQVTSVIE
jgi:hypothetical protein